MLPKERWPSRIELHSVFTPKDPTFPNSCQPMAKCWESLYQITQAHVLAVEIAGLALILERPPATGTVLRGIVVDVGRRMRMGGAPSKLSNSQSSIL